MRDSVNQWTFQWAQAQGIDTQFIANTTSTNTWAKETFNSLKPCIYTTDFQSHGRGRNTNTWSSPTPGDHLLSTWCFHSKYVVPYVLSVRVGAALYRTLNSTWPQVNFSLKAPNDIYINKEKLAGILIEVVSQKDYKICIGLGLNVFSSPNKAQLNSTSLIEHTPIEKSHWFVFCSRLFEALQEAVNNTEVTLSSAECVEAKKGLMQYYGSSLTHIAPDGTLFFSDGTKKIWKDL